MRTYRDFLQDRRAIARAVATYVDKISAKGGSRAIDTIRRNLESALTSVSATMETNPPPVAGSTWLENEALERTRMPLATGAGDAEIDGNALIAQAGLAGGIYPHWLGRGEAFRLATATAMETPTFRKFRRYQLWWADVWEEMAKAVIALWERAAGGEAGEFTVNVNSGAILEKDVAVISKALADLGDRGYVPKPEAMQIALGLLDVADPDKVIERVEAEAKARKEEEAARPPAPVGEAFTQDETLALFRAAERVVARG